MKPGDIVQLKSGGPRMTVVEVKEWSGEVRVWCTWFDAKNNTLSESFPLAALKPAGA